MKTILAPEKAIFIAGKSQTLASQVKEFFLKRAVLSILIVATGLRLYKINEVGISAGEIKNLDRITSFLDLRNFFNSEFPTNLYYFLQYLWCKFFGFSIFNMRLFSVGLSIIGLYIFYKFVEELFSKRIANISTFLLSISSFHILASRAISHEIMYPVLLLCVLYYLTLAYRIKKKTYFSVAGVFLGISFYASEINSVVALIFVASGVYFYSKNKKFLTSFVREKAIAVITSGFILTPFLYLLLKNPIQFLSRFTYSPGLFLDNIHAFFWSLFYISVPNYVYTVGTTQVFDPFIAFTSLLGLVYVILKIKRRKYYFLVVWIFIVSLSLLVKKEFGVGDFIYLVPVLFILTGVIQDYVLQKWFKTFPFNKQARTIMIIGIGFFFALSFTYNYQKVFMAWGKNPTRKLFYNEEAINAVGKDEKVYLFEANLSENAAKIIFLNNNISIIKKIEEIKDPGSAFIVTSEKQTNLARTMPFQVKWKEYEGRDMVVLKSE